MMPAAENTSEKSFYVTGGTLLPDAPSYVERAADEELYKALSSGDTCYVLNARQMGKSSLCVRTRLRLSQAGIRTAFCDLQASGGKNVTAEQWYIALLSKIGRELGVMPQFLTYWKEHAAHPPVQRLFGAISEVGLKAASSPIVIFIDEIDVTLSLPFSTDEFFAAIRHAFVGRATDSELNRLSFCLLGTASPADLIQDTRVSPFNIGKRIELQDFTASEAIRLADGFQTSEFSTLRKLDRAKIVERVLYWTGGHPFLTQRLCLKAKEALASEEKIAEDPNVFIDKLCHALFLSHSAKESDDNFAVVRNRLLKSEADLPALLDMYRKTRYGKPVHDDEANPLCSILKLSGVAKVENGFIKVRNRIYASVFDGNWIERHLPDAEKRRQKAAYRQGVQRTFGVASVILAAMAGLLIFAIIQGMDARRKTAEATIQRGIAEKQTRIANESAAVASAASEESKQRTVVATNATAEARQSAHKAQEARNESDRHAAEATKARDEATASSDLANREKNHAIASKSEAEAALESKKRALGQVELERNQKQYALGQADRLLYPQTIQRAERALEQGDSEEANRLLSKFIPTALSNKTKEGDPRGFEWRYLYKQAAKKSRENPIETLRETGRLETIAVSPNGSMIASANSGRVISLWEGKPFKKIGTLNEVSGGALYSSLKDILFIDDGKLLVATTYSGEIYLWNVQTRTLLKKYPSYHNQVVGGMAYDRVNGILATGTNGLRNGGNEPGGVIEYWKLEKDNRLSHQTKTALHTNASALPSWITCLAFSANGAYLASGGTESMGGNQMLTIRMWDSPNLEPIGKLEEKSSGFDNTNVTGVAFSPDGKWLISSNGDDFTRLFKLPDMKNESKRPFAIKSIAKGRHAGEVTCVAFSPDNAQFASGGKDANIKFWNASLLNANGSLTETATLLGHTDGIMGLAISADADHKLKVASCSEDGAINVWNTPNDSFKHVNLLEGRSGGIYQLVYSPNRKWLATVLVCNDEKGGRDFEVSICDADTHKIISTPIKRSKAELHLAVSPNNDLLAIGGSDHTLRLWSFTSRALLPAFEKVSQPVTALAFSPDGATLATCARGNESRNTYSYYVKEWSVSDRSLIRTLKEMRFLWDIECLAYSPDGKWLAGGGGHGELRLFDVSGKKTVNLSSEGFFIIPPGGTPSEAIRAHRNAIVSLAFSPDGKLLATGSLDRSVKLWSMSAKTASLRYTLRISNKVQTLSFTPDGKTLGVRSEDGQIRLYPLYSLPEGLLAESVSLKGEGITAFAFGPDDASVTMGSNRGSIQFR